ncbi:60S ribosomal protein L31 [Spraguea lophii 42_110]|uniref:60S ribosomal protein L31 n=1 Tax=Spraguea lophii (strain 42_110) TaxID=1358809 RepID=S7XW48_SPRLO|nr:Chain LDD, 60S ribosomal protein L31 [Spraguea lophii 42_110]7QJH_KDD Chain KDD, 60S ribosomal protein L31 [Spraguea lophii 42_110]7QJH_LDD Chain LDD, 60S ribosomal protein L31 [Spraguea lophii 42_110]8BR3_LDD Chain LDD, 60S ribosomal protein L31 [Spraguea lophii 42_110]8P5D_LDD Chain LDD, 60S ribosomal protein L31 [Spraguea lophii 42_110]8P60_KDD Chain KDD, 60S ribosomal protein L31 [Spraguea lophii 42_110]8P60_LDD Chain LDD, 60S ribosomal protein L31 [Spraguea lophii 42_110]EPR80098.1 6
MAFKDDKAIELTIPMGKITIDVSKRWKCRIGIRRLKKFITKTFHDKEAEVQISPDLNKFLWERGMRNVPKRVRVRVNQEPYPKDPSKKVYKLSHVVVSTFKGLGTEAIAE